MANLFFLLDYFEVRYSYMYGLHFHCLNCGMDKLCVDYNIYELCDYVSPGAFCLQRFKQ